MRLSKLMRLAGRPPSAGGPFSPLDYAGLQLWLDAQDITTLYKNEALTTPVTANGDLVYGWKDKSGNGAIKAVIDADRQPEHAEINPVPTAHEIKRPFLARKVSVVVL